MARMKSRREIEEHEQVRAKRTYTSLIFTGYKSGTNDDIANDVDNVVHAI